MQVMANVRLSALGFALALVAVASLQAQKGSSDSSSDDEEKSDLETKRAPGFCIADNIPKEINACPKAIPKKKSKGKGQAPKSKLQQAKRKVEQPKGLQVKGPSIELDVATLRNKENLQIRAKQLLTREITVTQRLLKNMKAGDDRRADVLLRLAEDFFELTQVANRDLHALDDPIYEACQGKKKSRKNCDLLKKKQKAANANLTKVREANITTLATLVKDHPNFKKMDEVLFSLGFSLEEMKQFDRARQVYHRLIKAYPQSKFIPNAYLSFAEYYFQEGDMRAAQQFYQKVTEIPPDRNKVYGYAVYKQAWCYYNLEDFKSALQSFIETIEFGNDNPEAPNVQNLLKQSRRELVMPYAQVGKPGKALEFFSRYAKDEDEAFEMFESLGELYFDTGKWPEVIAVYHELMSERSTDDKVCYWQTRVTNAIISSRPKPDQVTEIERMIDLWEAYMADNHKEDAQKTCKQAAASVLIDLATAWHREAIGTDTQPGTNDRGTMELASKLYRLILAKFPDMEQMEFPEIDKRDWPTEYKVSYYYAELLWRMEDWGECGPAFDRVLEVNPEGEYTEDAAYASVLCYNKQYQASYAQRETEVRGKDEKKGKGKKKDAEPTREELVEQFKPKEFSPLEEGMLRAYQRYVCFVQDGEDVPQIKYRRARIYYESNRFEEAAVIFKDIAFNYQDTDLAVFAANLYLDCLNVIGTYRDPARPSCYDDMNDAIEPLFKIYCSSESDREDHDELCSVVEQLRCDLMRKKAEGYQSNKEYKSAAQLYVRIFRKYPECGRLDEVLFNASINFEAARLLGRAIQVRKVLIDKYPESEWSKRATFLIGANYHALAFYEVAADYYEKFAEKYPKELGEDCTDAEKSAGTCVNANEALQNATFFRLGLGDEEKALEDANLFEKNYRKKFPRETSQVVYSIGSIYERQEDWKKLISHYSSYLSRYKKTAMPHELIEANVSCGRATLKMTEGSKKGPDRHAAGRYFRAALDVWQGSKDKFGELPISDSDKARYLALAKIGAAESLFHLGDEKFDDYTAISFPVFKAKAKAGGGMAKQKELQEKFQAWMAEDFVKWLEKKSASLAEAQKAYEQIAELKVPQWDIAAAARIGDMYLALVDQFREAPVPPVLESDEELVDIYYQGLDEASKPWVQKAKDAYEFCLITATKVRWFNKFMTGCERELFKLDPRTYPRAMELRGSDIYTYDANAVPGIPPLGAEEAGGVE